MSKVLFKLPSCNKEVTTYTCWINANKPRIVDMTDEHIENCRMWLHGNIQAEKAIYGCHKLRGGFTYPEWAIIFKGEEKRRQTLKLEAINIAKTALKSQLEQLDKMSIETTKYNCNFKSQDNSNYNADDYYLDENEIAVRKWAVAQFT